MSGLIPYGYSLVSVQPIELKLNGSVTIFMGLVVPVI